MRWAIPILLFGLLVAGTSADPPETAPAPRPRADEPRPKPDYVAAVRPVLKAYCFECHNTTKQKAGLNLEAIASEADAVGMIELWADVGQRVHAKEMPPGKSKQPNEAERKVLMGWVRHVADTYVPYEKLSRADLERALAAPPRSRRLNRTEYGNTLRDLFGVDLHAGDLLPSEGGGGEGFDNAGATLFTTPALMEKYLEAADRVLSAIFPTPAEEKARAVAAADAGRLAEVRKAVLIAKPEKDVPPSAAARRVLAAFLPKAFRRPTTDTEIDRYVGLFDSATKRGDPYDQAVRLALKGVLISPSFLFLVETPAEKPGVNRLGHYEVAAHLSYFLWSTMPDETLIDLAAKGKLHDESVLRGQVERMLRDPKSRGLADGFAAQWFGTRTLGRTVRPDARTFPEFDDDLAAAMREETVLFFDHIVRENRSVLEVIDANYTFVNERLAKHYKIDGVQGPQMRKVELKDPARGGVMGQAGILTVNSFPHRTSPVLRGRWVLEELLGADVPPPPPDVPVLNEKQKTEKPLTLRELLEKHRSKAECANCHNRMDPLGFGLENFDPLGRWRTEMAGKPVDSSGVLPTGEKFSGPAELKKLLLETRRTEFLRSLSRKALGYALGRELTRPDMYVVQECVAALEKGEFRSSRLFETIVLSFGFTHRNQLK